MSNGAANKAKVGAEQPGKQKVGLWEVNEFGAVVNKNPITKTFDVQLIGFPESMGAHVKCEIEVCIARDFFVDSKKLVKSTRAALQAHLDATHTEREFVVVAYYKDNNRWIKAFPFDLNIEFAPSLKLSALSLDDFEAEWVAENPLRHKWVWSLEGSLSRDAHGYSACYFYYDDDDNCPLSYLLLCTFTADQLFRLEELVLKAYLNPQDAAEQMRAWTGTQRDKRTVFVVRERELMTAEVTIPTLSALVNDKRFGLTVNDKKRSIEQKVNMFLPPDCIKSLNLQPLDHFNLPDEALCTLFLS